MNTTEYIFMLVLGVIVALLAVAAIAKHSKPLKRPRAPTWQDIVWYAILICFLNLIGLFIAIILWNMNHVKNGEWWGWWDKQKTVSGKRK